MTESTGHPFPIVKKQPNWRFQFTNGIVGLENEHSISLSFFLVRALWQPFSKQNQCSRPRFARALRTPQTEFPILQQNDTAFSRQKDDDV